MSSNANHDFCIKWSFDNFMNHVFYNYDFHIIFGKKNAYLYLCGLTVHEALFLEFVFGIQWSTVLASRSTPFRVIHLSTLLFTADRPVNRPFTVNSVCLPLFSRPILMPTGVSTSTVLFHGLPFFVSIVYKLFSEPSPIRFPVFHFSGDSSSVLSSSL